MNDRHRFILALFILLGTLAYGIWQWNTGTALAIQAGQLQTDVSTLIRTSSGLASEYQTIKKSVSVARESSAQELTQVFPTSENLSDLTRLLDTFAVRNNFDNNPFFIGSLNYQKAITPEGAPYQYVPVSMSVTTSKKNLGKFLGFVETSGSMEGQTRLMSVEDFSVDYPSEYGGAYEVRITINAYFAQAL